MPSCPLTDYGPEMSGGQQYFEINVLSGVRLSRAYVSGMKERKWGRVIFISSESALNTPKEMVHYGMTKTAQLAVSRGLAESCAGTGVTVNAILPGPTHSDGLEDFVTQLGGDQSFEDFEKEFFKTVRPSSLIKRFETTDEVARLVTDPEQAGARQDRAKRTPKRRLCQPVEDLLDQARARHPASGRIHGDVGHHDQPARH